MLKLIGAVIIIICSTCCGFYVAGRLEGRTRQLRELQMALQMLETEICYGSTPLETAFQKVGHSSSGSIGLLFERCAYYLQHLDGATTFECWQNALDELTPQLLLKKVELEWVLHFGKVVGTSDREDQQKHFQLLMTHLKKNEVEAKEEQHKYAKMYKTLGVLAGVLIVILMI